MFACSLCVLSANIRAADISAAVMNTDGTALADAIVYAVATTPPAQNSTPTPVTIDQVDKEFVPLVSAVRVGTSIHFPNSDQIRHQVYSFSPARIFNLKLYSGRPSSPVVFDKPGVVTLGCNIHDGMVGWVLVLDTPWFARTDKGGRAALTNLPAGEYQLHAWHPGMTGEPASVPVRLDASSQVERKLNVSATSIAQIRQALMASKSLQ
jgi:plastocyanin